STVTFTATADDNSEFDHWEGPFLADTVDDAEVSLLITGDTNVTAVFRLKPVLTIISIGTCDGVVVIDLPSGLIINYPSVPSAYFATDTVVTLSGTCDSGCN